MFREDKTARVERFPGGTTGLFKKTPLPDRYEFSVGKYTRSGNVARSFGYVALQAGGERFAELQRTQPIRMMEREGTQWWWYLDRFWKDDENLNADDVTALVLQGERKREAKLERARLDFLRNLDPAYEAEIRKDDEREEKQRLLDERVADVEARNASLEATISALENVLGEALDRDSTVEVDSDDGDPEAVVSYFSSVLDGSPYPEGFPKKHRVAFVPESRQLVVEYELPTLTIVPAVKAYRYVRSRNAIDETALPATQTRALYGQVVAQTALRTLHELFQADRDARAETIVLNCFVDTIDPATGQPARPCLITVRTSRESFETSGSSSSGCRESSSSSSATR